MLRRSLASILLIGSLGPNARAEADAIQPLAWPSVTQQTKPGIRWWWMGDAVEPNELKRELKTFHDAGLGTVEITPIYGVHGYENQTIPYLSAKWLEMLNLTTSEAQKFGIDVDMITGTGWCFGGPTVSDQDANAIAIYKDGTLSLKPTVKVKRPAPGEQGWMLNLLFPDAMTRYLQRFSEAFDKYKGVKPHAQFHDSYEYKSDWSPDFLTQFEKRRGYKLEPELPALFDNKGDVDHAARVRSDYQETVSELIEESIARWTDWSHAHAFVSRNQAHGSPGNWLDIYAASDIPETEFDFTHPNILVSKFASSAAHTAGKKLTSSETGTWAAEHFNETLARLKQLCDELFLAGVNRIMWHGTTYSPADAPWPGWCFYASTEMNPRNALWHDAPALHAYLTRVQSLLQSGRSDNDVLVYWPIHDLWHHQTAAPKEELAKALTVHDVNWFTHESIGETAAALWNRGYAFDYTSDQLLQHANTAGGTINLGEGRYRAILVPHCSYMPVETMQKLRELAEGGATIIFEDDVPQDIPGLRDLEKQRAELRALASPFSATPANRLDAVLAKAGVRRESALVGHDGLHFVRRAVEGGRVYFISNQGTAKVDAPIALSDHAAHAAIFDPMTARTGLTEMADGAIRLQLDPGESILVRTFHDNTSVNAAAQQWAYQKPLGEPIELNGTWSVKFLEGGPVLPKRFETAKLDSWTTLGDDDARRFSGTALYALHFDAPSGARARGWSLDLGNVIQSARVRLNGADLGTVFTAPFRVAVGALKPKANLLEIEVTGTSANRIRDLDTRGVRWKIFYDINIVGKNYKPLNAASWPIAEQGLLGPVRLQAQADQ